MLLQPKVSIIIPVYNTEKDIGVCIESVLQQTETNIEIILVNDGSTDKSGSICDKYAKTDKRIQVLHQQNKGAGPARNQGIYHAQGEYLYFMDSDDRIKKTLIEDNYGVAVKHHSDVVVFGYKKIEKRSNGKSYTVNTTLKNGRLKNKKEIIQNLTDLLDSGATFAVWNKLFRTEMVRKHGINYPSIKRNQDMAFTLDAYKYASSIDINNKFYYYYSFSPVLFKYDENLIEHHIFIYDMFYNLFENWMLDSKNRKYAIKMFVLYFFHSVPFFIVSHDLNPIKKLKRLYFNPDFGAYLKQMKVKEAENSVIAISLLLLKLRSSWLLYIVSKLKIILSQRLGKDKLRKLLNN